MQQINAFNENESGVTFDGDLLVDSGMGVVSLREWVPLVTERPLLAVASHTHFDHIGCHHEFPDRAVHRAEAELLAHPGRWETLADPYVTDDIFDTLPPEPYQSSTYEVTPAPATRLLEDREVVDAGGRKFEVVHTPGHSPGGIGLFEKATGILFAADAIYDGPLIYEGPGMSVEDYRKTFDLLKSLPVATIHGGHDPSFDRARMLEIIAHYETLWDAA